MTTTRTWTALVGAAALLLGAAADQAQGTPMYKCGHRDGVTYSQVPCPGGRQLGVSAPSRTDKRRPVPQDRATIARRAVLTAEERQECKVLDRRLVEQAAQLEARGESVTLDDEMPLVRSKKRFRELHC